MQSHQKYTFHHPLLSSLSIIERIKGFLDAAHLSSRWLSIKQEDALIFEAHHATHLDGAKLTLNNSRQILSGDAFSLINPDDAKELVRYKNVLDYIVHSSAPRASINASNYSCDISKTFLLEIYSYLEGAQKKDHSISCNQENFFSSNLSLETSQNFSTPSPILPTFFPALEFLDRLNQEKNIHPVIKAGILLYQLMLNSPFPRNNGKIARLVSLHYLYQTGYDYQKQLIISKQFNRSRKEYHQAVQSIKSDNMDMTQWLEFFLKTLATEAEEIKQAAVRFLRLEDLANRFKVSLRQRESLEALLDKKGEFTIKDYESCTPKINRRSLQRDLSDLIEKGIILRQGTKKGVCYQIHLNE